METKCFLRYISEEIYSSNFKIKQRAVRDRRSENCQEKERTYISKRIGSIKILKSSIHIQILSLVHLIFYVLFTKKQTKITTKLISLLPWATVPLPFKTSTFLTVIFSSQRHVLMGSREALIIYLLSLNFLHWISHIHELENFIQ